MISILIGTTWLNLLVALCWFSKSPAQIISYPFCSFMRSSTFSPAWRRREPAKLKPDFSQRTASAGMPGGFVFWRGGRMRFASESEKWRCNKFDTQLAHHSLRKAIPKSHLGCSLPLFSHLSDSKNDLVGEIAEHRRFRGFLHGEAVVRRFPFCVRSCVAAATSLRAHVRDADLAVRRPPVGLCREPFVNEKRQRGDFKRHAFGLAGPIQERLAQGDEFSHRLFELPELVCHGCVSRDGSHG